ncbi:MAG: molybdenum cofactor guanylyltransferase [Leptospirillia bacterium]
MTTMPISGVSGALLAGGQSRRMGTDKAVLNLGGVALAERGLAVLSTLFDDILAVDRPVRDPGAHKRPPWPAGVRAVADPECLPACALTGILGALAAARYPWVMVLACDMPFPSAALIRGLCRTAMAESAPLVVPRAGGMLHPLCAVYHRDLAPEIQKRIEAGRLKVGELAKNHARIVEEADLTVWDPSLAGLVNLNTPEEFEAARAALDEPVKTPGKERSHDPV